MGLPITSTPAGILNGAGGYDYDPNAACRQIVAA
mgnify:CR=1 FL=1